MREVKKIETVSCEETITKLVCDLCGAEATHPETENWAPDDCDYDEVFTNFYVRAFCGWDLNDNPRDLDLDLCPNCMAYIRELVLNKQLVLVNEKLVIKETASIA